MKIIKTPTGIVQVDDPARVLTLEEYDALSDSEKNEGLYFITDAGNENNYANVVKLMGIVGDTDLINIGDGTVTGIIYLFNKSKANKTDLNSSNVRISSNEDAIKEINTKFSSLKDNYDNMEFGIRNLILDSNNGAEHWTTMTENGTLSVAAYSDSNGTSGAKFTQQNNSGAYCSMVYDDINNKMFEHDKDYVVSFRIFSNINSNLKISLQSPDGDTIILPETTLNNAVNINKWSKISVVIRSSDAFRNTDECCLIINAGTVDTETYFIVEDLSVVRGYKAICDWFPAIEDIHKSIEELSKQITGLNESASSIDKFALDSKLNELDSTTKSISQNMALLQTSTASNASVNQLNSSINKMSMEKASTADIEDLENADILLNNKIDTLASQTSDLFDDVNDTIDGIKDDLSSNYVTLSMLNSNNTNVSELINAKLDELNSASAEKLADIETNLQTINSKIGDDGELTTKINSIDNAINQHADQIYTINNSISDINSKLTELSKYNIDDINYKFNSIDTTLSNTATKDDISSITTKLDTINNNINDLNVNKASDYDFQRLSEYVETVAESTRNLSNNKADKTDITSISSLAQSANKLAVNNASKLYSSNSSGNSNSITIKPKNFDVVSQKGSLLLFGAPSDVNDSLISIVNVQFGSCSILNLGSIKLECSIDTVNSSIIINNITTWTRVTVIEA